MQYYAVIDTNVIVSAMLKWDSIPGSILELALDGPITPVLNHEILEEYRQVLLRPKFHLTERIVGDLLDNISARAVFADAHKLMLELPDSKDVVFYEVTMEHIQYRCPPPPRLGLCGRAFANRATACAGGGGGAL